MKKQGFWKSRAEIRDLLRQIRLKYAIKTFSPMKEAGPDNIKQVVLQNLPNCYLERLGQLFDAVITAGYNPTSWRKARVVYISKAGKDSYDTPKSFRPFSLTPFIFKTLERLVHRHLLEARKLRCIKQLQRLKRAQFEVTTPWVYSWTCRLPLIY